MTKYKNLPDESIIFKRHNFTDLEKLLFCQAFVKELRKEKELHIQQFKDYAVHKNKEIAELNKKMKAIKKENTVGTVINKKNILIQKLRKKLKLEETKVNHLLLENRKLILNKKS